MGGQTLPRDAAMRTQHTPRSLYLSGMGAVYVCAFVSYWLQYPGLLGASGLLRAAAPDGPRRASRARIIQNQTQARGPLLARRLPQLQGRHDARELLAAAVFVVVHGR